MYRGVCPDIISLMFSCSIYSRLVELAKLEAQQLDKKLLRKAMRSPDRPKSADPGDKASKLLIHLHMGLYMGAYWRGYILVVLTGVTCSGVGSLMIYFNTGLVKLCNEHHLYHNCWRKNNHNCCWKSKITTAAVKPIDLIYCLNNSSCY